MMPRLIGLNASLSRQAGGIGSKGPGEKKLELDRRRIEEQVHKLNKELDSLVLARQNQRKLRKRNSTPVVALVGYTNAGKSTTMNALLTVSNAQSEKSVFEKNMLFATLETSTRHIQLPDNKQFLLTDTVGFVGRLPHHLVKAFRSTLEEARDADLLLQVVDVSHEEHRFMMEVTGETLTEVGVENVPSIHVFNKSDLADVEYPKVKGNSIWLSAKNGEGLEELVELIKSFVFDQYVTCKLLVPFDRGDVVAYLNEHANVKKVDYEEEGTLMVVEMLANDREKYDQFMISY